jgi:diguanylate cyclase (GGDEF)-like protein/PAS domain S-box-containing protein
MSRAVPVRHLHIFENFPDGLLVFTQDEHLLDINNQAQHWLGESKNKLVSQHIDFVFRNWPGISNKLRNEPETKFFQARGEGLDRKLLEVRSQKILTETNLPLGRIVIVRDISNNTFFEDRLQASQMLLDHMVNASRYPIYDSTGKIYAPADIKADIRRGIETEELLRLQIFALDAVANAIVITDRNGSIQWVNPAFTKLTGYSLDESIGENLRILKSPTTSINLYDELWQTISRGVVWQGELVNRRKDGSDYIEEQTITPLYDHKGVISHFIAIKQDITSRRTAEYALRKAHEELKAQYDEINALKERLQEQAIRDSLTGLFNRRYLQETLPRELARALRENKSLSLLMIDIDHFKSVNDSLGHAAGDLLLRGLGELMRCLIRESDIACRYGGEEFIAVLPGASSKDCQSRAEAFRAGFEKLTVFYENEKINRTISIGVATFPDHGTGAEMLLQAADRALYQAKANGRNRISFFHPDLNMLKHLV